ncbi:hypothetical protein BD310DRAFT_937380 [Dichomitus squalens]|uniref:Uncharacterized protein n=1 Tax=Dichomitus squalens TaxID=114155 RepID=A0A4Q9PFX0_9APHY|nr:hypothetical protein BD310DRAFT_937380 [Dichomitus squalens]
MVSIGYYRQLRGKGASRKLELDATQTLPLSALHSVDDVSADEVRTGKVSRVPINTFFRDIRAGKRH